MCLNTDGTTLDAVLARCKDKEIHPKYDPSRWPSLPGNNRRLGHLAFPECPGERCSEGEACELDEARDPRIIHQKECSSSFSGMTTIFKTGKFTLYFWSKGEPGMVMFWIKSIGLGGSAQCWEFQDSTVWLYNQNATESYMGIKFPEHAQ